MATPGVEFSRLDRIFEVRSWLDQNKLLGNFKVRESDGHALLEQTEADMYSGSDLDPLFQMIAEFVAGTPLDGQVVPWEYGSSTGVYVLVAGKVETLESDVVIVSPATPLAPGECGNVTMTVRAMGLPGGRAVVIGTPATTD